MYLRHSKLRLDGTSLGQPRTRQEGVCFTYLVSTSPFSPEGCCPHCDPSAIGESIGDLLTAVTTGISPCESARLTGVALCSHVTGRDIVTPSKGSHVGDDFSSVNEEKEKALHACRKDSFT